MSLQSRVKVRSIRLGNDDAHAVAVENLAIVLDRIAFLGEGQCPDFERLSRHVQNLLTRLALASIFSQSLCHPEYCGCARLKGSQVVQCQHWLGPWTDRAQRWSHYAEVAAAIVRCDASRKGR